ncbi:MAG: T9SS type A sorting domain-containing protein, partial [Firmicutes bacterium]|nr:T9SS type A sorting domain-containing protein [Bacillota bacterium]
LDSLWNIGNIPPDLGDDEEEGGGGNGNNPPCNLNLKTNYFPNPVKDLLHVEYYFECQANVTITLFDMNGIPVVTIPKELLNKGMYRDEINCTALPPGMYVLRLSVGGEVVSGIISKK